MPGYRLSVGPIHNGGRLVLVPNRVTTEPTRWRHSGCIQVTVQYGPKRLSGFPKFDLFAIGRELCSRSNGVYVHHTESSGRRVHDHLLTQGRNLDGRLYCTWLYQLLVPRGFLSKGQGIRRKGLTDRPQRRRSACLAGLCQALLRLGLEGRGR